MVAPLLVPVPEGKRKGFVHLKSRVLIGRMQGIKDETWSGDTSLTSTKIKGARSAKLLRPIS